MPSGNAKQRTNRLVETLLAPGLDTEIQTPLNEQLTILLQDAILTGHLLPGDRLPASRSMASRLSISRNTVLAAYDQLTAEGYLESKVGSGTYVSTDLPDHYMQVSSTLQAKEIQKNKPAISRPLAGMPALDEFPFDLWGRISGRVWRQANMALLQHNDPAGFFPLREAIADYLQAARGVLAHPDQIIITSGLQQGLKLVTESVVAPEKSVILENPGYPGLLKTALHMPNPTRFTHVDDAGAQVPKKHDVPPGLLLITPSRQYPLGMTMPISRRLELLDWAKKHNCLILEDDYDSEFRYGGRPIQSLQGLDGGKQVIYGGSFSKSLFLSLRIGYMVLPEHLASRVIDHRERTESFPALGDQMVLTQFITEGHFSRHLRRLRNLHKERLTRFLSETKALLGHHFDIVDTDAGLHVLAIARGKTATYADELLASVAHKSGLGAVPISRAFVKIPPQKGLMFGFANISENEMQPKLTQLAAELDEITGF